MRISGHAVPGSCDALEASLTASDYWSKVAHDLPASNVECLKGVHLSSHDLCMLG